MPEYESHDYDAPGLGQGYAELPFVVITARQGARTALLGESLLGKAHTVMPEGGAAAAMGSDYEEDNWKVHFRDTMRGGKMLNNWRMAQLHVDATPRPLCHQDKRGGLFDRTPAG